MCQALIRVHTQVVSYMYASIITRRASYLASRSAHSVLPPKICPSSVRAHVCTWSQEVPMVIRCGPNASAKPHSWTGLWPELFTFQGGKLVVKAHMLLRHLALSKCLIVQSCMSLPVHIKINRKTMYKVGTELFASTNLSDFENVGFRKYFF